MVERTLSWCLQQWRSFALLVRNWFSSFRDDLREEVYLEKINKHRSKLPWTIRVPGTRSRKDAEEIYFRTTFTLLAKMAKADGSVSRAEVFAVEDFLDRELVTSAKQHKYALRIFNEARYSTETFEDCVLKYYSMFQAQPEMLENMMDVLLSVAYADAQVSSLEKECIETTRRIFCLSDPDFHRIFSRHVDLKRLQEELDALRTLRGEKIRDHDEREAQGEKPKMSVNSDLDRACAILGVQISEAEQSIKKKYRRLVMEFHPDRLSSKGVPKEFLKIAEKRFREIQDAYEKVRKSRGLS